MADLPKVAWRIPGGFKRHGKAIRIIGIVKKNASTFALHLRNKNGLIAFRLACDLEGGLLGCNGILDEDDWGDEENNAELFPFERGMEFELRLEYNHGKYIVSFGEEGEHLLDFELRRPARSIRIFECMGDAKIKSISIVRADEEGSSSSSSSSDEE